MRDEVASPDYAGYRLPPEVISHAVWLYCRFAFSYHDVEGLLVERGLTISDETIRRWCLLFGQASANALRRRRPRPGDTWHLDEVFIRISGRTYHLWRAGDQDGAVLDILVQSRCDTRAATRFFRKSLTGLRYVPRVVSTDKLASYGAARQEVLPSVEHRQHKRLNNRAENSHRPTRGRGRRMRRFVVTGSRTALPRRVWPDRQPRPPAPPPPRHC